MGREAGVPFFRARLLSCFSYSLHTLEGIVGVLGGGACTRNKHFSLRPGLALKAVKPPSCHLVPYNESRL